MEGCYGASTLFYALPPAYVEPWVETRWRPRASLRKLIPRGFSYHFRCTRVMLLAPSIHDLFSLLFPSSFLPSIHPPRLLSSLLIHAGIDTQLSSVHPPELFPPRSTEGIGSYPSFLLLSCQARKEEKKNCKQPLRMFFLVGTTLARKPCYSR